MLARPGPPRPACGADPPAVTLLCDDGLQVDGALVLRVDIVATDSDVRMVGTVTVSPNPI